MNELRIVKGLAGSGKSQYCIKQIAEEIKKDPLGEPIYLIVPEQSSYEMERWLANECGGGFLRAQVFGFKRFSWYLHARCAGRTVNNLSDLGRRLVLRRILQECNLQSLKNSARYVSFTGEIAQILREFKTFGIEPQSIYQLVEDKRQRQAFENSSLLSKLEDLAIVYEKWLAYKTKNDLVDPEDMLLTAINCLQSGIIADSQIWIDGFVFFSPPERAFINSLLSWRNTITVTLCNTVAQDKLNLFSQQDRTERLLKQIAEQQKCAVHMVELSCQMRGYQPLLNALSGLKLGDCLQNDEFVHIVAASNPVEETDWLVREIVSLKLQYGYNWADFVIACRDFANYEINLKKALQINAVPFAFDKPQMVAKNRLIELLKALFELAINRHWHYETVFAVLKSGLFTTTEQERSEIDALENYCLKFGINSKKRWLHKFDDKKNSGSEEVKLRWGVLLEELLGILATGKTVATMADALLAILQRLAVKEKIISWQDSGNADLHRLQEMQLVWQALLDATEELKKRFGDEDLDLKSFSVLLIEALTTIEIKTVPAGNDYVAISQFDRLKMPQRKVVCLIGCNEGVIPAQSGGGAVLTPRERQKLAEWQVELSVAGKDKLTADCFTFYSLLAQATERLYLSYAMEDNAGKTLGPALLVKRLLTNNDLHLTKTVLNENTVGIEDELKYLTTERRAVQQIVTNLSDSSAIGAKKKFWLRVQEELTHNPYTMKVLGETYAGQSYRYNVIPVNVELLSDAATETNKIWKTSVSQLESYKSCPFLYFCKYHLAVKSREMFELAGYDFGTIFHDLLVKVFNTQKWLNIQDSLQVYDSLTDKFKHGLLGSSNFLQDINRRKKLILGNVIEYLQDFSKQSNFKPAMLEKSFQITAGSLIDAINNEWHIKLEGKIDRIDTGIIDNNKWLMLVDYKSGRRSAIDYARLLDGSSLQLPLYLLATSTLYKKILSTAGMAYMPLSYPRVTCGNIAPLSNIAANEAKESRDKARIFSGLYYGNDEDDLSIVNEIERVEEGERRRFLSITKNRRENIITAGRFAQLIDNAQTRMQDIVGSIVAGRFPPQPLAQGDTISCSYCEFSRICQMDKRKPYAARKLEKVSSEQFWLQLAERQGE